MMMMAFPQLRPRIVSLGSGKIALCMLLPLLRDKAKKIKKEDEKKWGKTKTKSGEGAAGECCGAEVNEDSLGL